MSDKPEDKVSLSIEARVAEKIKDCVMGKYNPQGYREEDIARCAKDITALFDEREVKGEFNPPLPI